MLSSPTGSPMTLVIGDIRSTSIFANDQIITLNMCGE